MNHKKRICILKRLDEKKDKPVVKLYFSSVFELLISVMLSAQATDMSVNKAVKKMYSVANTPQSIINLGVEGIKYYIKTIGIFNKKADYIIKICHILLEKHGGIVPENRSALEALPGVGRKTANIVLNIAFGWPSIAVDTHVFRVCNRTKFACGKNVKQVEEKLLKFVPKTFRMNCHKNFMTHGRYICKAKNPSCRSCIINDLCEFKEKLLTNTRHNLIKPFIF